MRGIHYEDVIVVFIVDDYGLSQYHVCGFLMWIISSLVECT
jgi:hypothetical protein